MGIFDDTTTMRGAPKHWLFTGREPKCVQSGCKNLTTGSAIQTVGGSVHACSKHKEVAGGKKRKTLAEVEKRALKAESRRQKRERERERGRES